MSTNLSSTIFQIAFLFEIQLQKQTVDPYCSILCLRVDRAAMVSYEVLLAAIVGIATLGFFLSRFLAKSALKNGENSSRNDSKLKGPAESKKVRCCFLLIVPPFFPFDSPPSLHRFLPSSDQGGESSRENFGEL